MTVVEAMALGTPIVAAAIGGLVELLGDGVEGRQFKAGDAVDLRRVIHELLVDPEALAAMGRRARARYLARLSPKRNLEILTGIYEEMVAGRDQI
jgi:glycosyltransferase involved in cell wall biosynthesis